MSKNRVAVGIAILFVVVFTGIGCTQRVPSAPVATELAPSPPASVPPYMSTCVIKASRSRVVMGDRRADEPPHLTAGIIVDEQMLRYGSVMAALRDTDLMNELERQCEERPERRADLEDELHRRIIRNIRIEPLGKSKILFKISYRDDTPDQAVTVLRRIVGHFVEHALKQERDDARKTWDLARANLNRAKSELTALDDKIAAFLQKHPQLHAPNARDRLGRAVTELRDSEMQTSRLKGRHAYRTKQLDAETDPAKKNALETMIHELRANLAAEAAVQRKLRLDKAQLEKEAAALPALEGEYAKLTRDKTAAEEHLANTLKKFRTAHETFSTAIRGMLSFSIIRPARKPHAKSPTVRD